jgi:hypothetical protein
MYLKNKKEKVTTEYIKENYFFPSNLSSLLKHSYMFRFMTELHQATNTKCQSR